MRTINAFSPLGGTLIKEYPVFEAPEIAAAMLRAQETLRIYGEVDIAGRIKMLRSLRLAIADESDLIAETVAKSVGKVKAEVLMTEVLPTLAALRYYEKNLHKILAHRRLKVPFPFTGTKAKIELRAAGISLIISSWNFPFYLSFIPVIEAIAAGNTVLLKPSEFALPVGELIENICKSAGFPTYLVQCLYGDKETVSAAIKARPARIFFTGSTATGKQIMAQASEFAIPVLLELGGKAPLIVFADADFTRAVNGAVFGSFCNSGQVCVAASRIYVERKIYNDFCDELAAKANSLIQGDINTGDLGFMISSATFGRLNILIKDAVSKGAKVLCGNLAGKYFSPVVLIDVTPEMLVMKEEIFGPLIPIMPFDGSEEVINLANNTSFGLSASIWSGDMSKARRVAAKITAGGISINDVIQYVSIPSLPFGGTKESGIGRYHGGEGIKFFCDEISITKHKNAPASSVAWFPYGNSLYSELNALIKHLYGHRHNHLDFYRKAFRLWRRNFRKN